MRLIGHSAWHFRRGSPSKKTSYCVGTKVKLVGTLPCEFILYEKGFLFFNNNLVVKANLMDNIPTLLGGWHDLVPPIPITI